MTALALDLTFKQVNRLIDRTKHRVISQLWLGAANEFSESGQSCQAHLVRACCWQISDLILPQPLPHRTGLARPLGPHSQPILSQEALVIVQQFVAKAGPGDICQLHF